MVVVAALAFAEVKWRRVAVHRGRIDDGGIRVIRPIEQAFRLAKAIVLHEAAALHPNLRVSIDWAACWRDRIDVRRIVVGVGELARLEAIVLVLDEK